MYQHGRVSQTRLRAKSKLAKQYVYQRIDVSFKNAQETYVIPEHSYIENHKNKGRKNTHQVHVVLYLFNRERHFPLNLLLIF